MSIHAKRALHLLPFTARSIDSHISQFFDLLPFLGHQKIFYKTCMCAVKVALNFLPIRKKYYKYFSCLTVFQDSGLDGYIHVCRGRVHSRAADLLELGGMVFNHGLQHAGLLLVISRHLLQTRDLLRVLDVDDLVQPPRLGLQLEQPLLILLAGRDPLELL